MAHTPGSLRCAGLGRFGRPHLPSSPLCGVQVEAALDAMEAANKVMHREGRIHLI